MVHSLSAVNHETDSSILKDARIVALAFQDIHPVEGEERVLKRQLSSTSFGSISDVSEHSKKKKIRSQDDSPVDVQDSESEPNSGVTESQSRCSTKRKHDAAELNTDSQRSMTSKSSLLNDEESTGLAGIGSFSHPLTNTIIWKDKTKRQRYIGENLVAAHNAIVLSLRNRLQVKSKQNSSLVQCLPAFVGISGVRLLSSERLEKWLQSPALSVQARSLFSTIVDNLEAVDPPLQDDLAAIGSILSLKLKANQVSLVSLHFSWSDDFASLMLISPVSQKLQPGSLIFQSPIK